MLKVSGFDEAAAALQAMAIRVEAATPRALATGGALLDGKTRANLSRTSHQRGTPTPSRPGEPPSLISGRLRSSMRVTVPVREGETWKVIVGPTTVYARIQELGGVAGRGHRSHLPARPYLRPAAEALINDSAYRDVFTRAWGAAIRA